MRGSFSNSAPVTAIGPLEQVELQLHTRERIPDLVSHPRHDPTQRRQTISGGVDRPKRAFDLGCSRLVTVGLWATPVIAIATTFSLILTVALAR